MNTKNKAIVIFASSNEDGNTAKLLKSLDNLLDLEIIKLNDYNIGFFDYKLKHKADDHLPLVRKILEYDKVIFACPVYWYTMPAQMKVFFDRFSDILVIEKDVGRQLRGKKAYILSTGADTKPKRSFEEVFRNSFKYLGMKYQSMLYAACPETYIEADNISNIKAFSDEFIRS